MPYEELMGRRLKELRLAAGMKQEEVAAKIGISSTTYSNIETGYATSTKLRTIVALADLHNVSVDYILGRTDAR